jgi:hypothetical protein
MPDSAPEGRAPILNAAQKTKAWLRRISGEDPPRADPEGNPVSEVCVRSSIFTLLSVFFSASVFFFQFFLFLSAFFSVSMF